MRPTQVRFVSVAPPTAAHHAIIAGPLSSLRALTDAASPLAASLAAAPALRPFVDAALSALGRARLSALRDNASTTIPFVLPQATSEATSVATSVATSEATSEATTETTTGEAMTGEAMTGDTAGILALVAVPTSFSRANSPARADALLDLLTSVVSALPSASSRSSSSITSVALVLLQPEADAHVRLLPHALATVRLMQPFLQKSSRQTPCLLTVSAFNHNGPAPHSLWNPEYIQNIADSISKAAYIVDAPPCIVNTNYMVDLAKKVAEEVGLQEEPLVIQGQELGDRGFGGLWNVGKAAAQPPALVVLHYKPEGAEKIVALVGKGIVYDTGGLSIKPREGMVGMKRDMGGSAACLMGFRALVLNKCPHEVYALLCLAENAINERAYRPDDIITLYSGKTIEINNPDAEGRLVLGDGVAYAAKELNPSVILDMATLTGAQGIATGSKHAAVVCNDDELEAQAIRAGKLTGDLVHPLPYCPEFYRKEFSSTIADMKNSVKNRSNAQSSCAAQFVADQLPSSYEKPWIHVDMAYPVESGDRATGYGVALIHELFNPFPANQ